MEVLRVLQRKDGVKMVIIPKYCQIKKGEQVLVTNNLRLINKFIEVEYGENRKTN